MAKITLEDLERPYDNLDWGHFPTTEELVRLAKIGLQVELAAEQDNALDELSSYSK